MFKAVITRGILLRAVVATVIVLTLLSPSPAAQTRVELTDLRDYNTRVWCVQRDVKVRRHDGTEETQKVERRIIEKGSGICYRDEQGNFKPSNPHWEPTPEGFVLRECAYGLSAGKTLADPIVYTTRGERLNFRPAFLKASSGSTMKLVAAVDTNVKGVVDAEDRRRLVFPGAFGALGDLEILAKKGSLHQNLILKKAPTAGLDRQAQDARLSLYTELSLDDFLAGDGAHIRFGSNLIRSADASLGIAPSKAAPIAFYKTISDGSGSPKEVLHHFFAESPVYSAADGEPAALVGERAERRLFRDPQTSATYLVESVPLTFLDQADYPIVWDFCNIPDNYEPGEPWIPAITYHITANFYVTSGALQILPGTVIKLNPYVSIYASGGAIHAKGEPYDYIVFTKTRDDNCGEIITGVADVPYMCAIYLTYGWPGESVVQYCKMGYGYFGVLCGQSLGADNPIAHNIIRGQDLLWIGIKVHSGANTSCHNNLITDSTWLGINYYGSGGYETNITNNTVDGANVAVQLQYSTFDNVTDNLLSNTVFCGIDVGSFGTSTVNLLDHNGYWMVGSPVAGGAMGPNSIDLDDSQNPYQSSSVGEYYLNDIENAGRELRDRPGGRSAEEAGLLAEQFTVNRPGLAQASVTSNRYWLKHEPDTDVVDIGYHHNRVDWLLDGADTVVTNSGLILIPGLVIAVAGQGTSLRVGTEGKLICPGNPHQHKPNVFASDRSVSMDIESSLKLDPAGPQNDLQVGVALSADSIFDSRIRNTVFRGLYKGVDAGRWCVFPIKNCRFDQNIFGIESYGGALSATNNVFAWNETGVAAALPVGAHAEFRNNTFDGNWWEGLHLNTVSGSSAVLKDNLFTSNNCGIQVYGAGDVQYGHNGFYANATPEPQPYPKEGDVFLASCPYYRQGVDSKRWFLDQGTPLVNGGSTTTIAAKLLPYVTAYDESYDVGPIDIGYHAFGATGPDTPDPDAPTLEIGEILGYESYPGKKVGGITVTLDITEDNEYSCQQVQVYVDGEFAASAAVGEVQNPPEEEELDPPGELPYTLAGSCGIDTTLLLNWTHTVQALSENQKPATGASDPVPFETYNYVHCVSMSRNTCNFVAGDTLEVSALVFAYFGYPGCLSGVRFTRIPFDPPGEDPYYFWVDASGPHWRTQTVKSFPLRYSWIVHEEWDGTLSPDIVEDGLVQMEIHAMYPGGEPDSVRPIAVSSREIAEAEVGIFLPEVFFWDRITAQAVVNAAKRLKLPFRVFLKEEANWCNLETFLTVDRGGEGPERPHPSVLYVAAHGNYIERVKDDYGQSRQYQVTHFVLHDAVVYATTDPGQDYGGELPAWFRAKKSNKFIYDPICDTGLEDPWGYGLYESGWVKFVWVDACYSHCHWGGSMCDMGRALGMMSDDNIENQDQSYIGFANETPSDWYDGWLMAAYAWLFWDFLSIVNDAGNGPAYGTENARGFTADVISAWAHTWQWAAPLLYLVAINRISEPALYAMLRDHLP